jgi:[glutamine synthetase] adenylyltransferase / [glutamine synthetase]-adenylyl-L-tyrosine phosphorylase
MNAQDWKELSKQIETQRQQVDFYFNQVFREAEEHEPQDELDDLFNTHVSEHEAHLKLEQLGFKRPSETFQRLRDFLSSARYQHLPATSQKRLRLLIPLIMKEVIKAHDADETLLRLILLLETICRRASYLALLVEYPITIKTLCDLCRASQWLAQYLCLHPVLLDELLDAQQLLLRPDFSALKVELKRRLDDSKDDIERQMDIMRDFKHITTFRLAAMDVLGLLPLRTLSDYLSDLADLILDVTMSLVWETLKGKHLETPRFAIIGYGKLGAKELGYASDLDLIFLYEDDSPGASDCYGRYAQRLNYWLSSLTNSGMLYEIDLALRPDGASGLLVSDTQAFEDYQKQKAWVWEHQAITRARFCAGDAKVGHRFEEIRKSIITLPRNPASLANSVREMRQKMRINQPAKPGEFDVKFGEGGIVDIEFIVQYFILCYANQYPDLTVNEGNVALLNRMANHGLLSIDQAKILSDAYLLLRQLQHTLKLQGRNKVIVPIETVLSTTRPVYEIWHKLFNE